MIEWDKLKAMPKANKIGGVRWDELKAMPDVSADELKRLREKPIYANAIRQANERIAMAESTKRSGAQYKIGLDEMWNMDYDGKSTEELLYDLACEKYGIPNDSESYLKRSGKQVLLGNYTDDVTALGTAGQMLLGLTGLDAPADVRDLYYDLTHWDWSLGHAGQTALDALSLLPGVGGIKYVDEAGEVLQNGLKRLGKAEGFPATAQKNPDIVQNLPDSLPEAEQNYINKYIEAVNRYIDKSVESQNRYIDTGYGAMNAKNKYVDKGVNSMNDLIDTNIAGKKSWYKADGTINMPPNDGAVLGTKEITDLQPGKRLGRYGGYTKNSDFLAETGSSADGLSLPPYTNTSFYQEFEVLKPIPRVSKSLVEPWGNSAGWGTQLKLPMTIQELIDQFYIRIL